MTTNAERPRPFTDPEFNEIRRNLTARGPAGEDTVHAGAAKMFERLFATVDKRATIESEANGRVYCNLIDPGDDWMLIVMMVRSEKTGTLAVQQSRVRRELVLGEVVVHPMASETFDAGVTSLRQLLAAEGA
jgi:hypothetical protein